MDIARRFRVGIDVGGTFTDVSAYDTSTGATVHFKVPSTGHDPSRGVVDGLMQLTGGEAALDEIVHGTTIATNAMLERHLPVTALVTTRNFRDVLEIGRQYRPNLYNLRDNGRPRPLVPRDLRLEITERIATDGSVLAPLAADEIPALVDQMKAAGVEAVAVSLINSYANPAHERALRDALREFFQNVSASSDVDAQYREYERTNTVVVNVAVMSIVCTYLDRLSDQLQENGLDAPLFLVQSNGGMMSMEAAKVRPANMLMSGPAAGVAASRYLLQQLGIDNAVTFDMGGTSTDVCLITGGEAALAQQRRIGGQPVRVPSLNIETIGAGGGSLARVDRAGALKVGPESAGAEPGPACYGHGGTEPTVTDANLLLGYLNPEAVFGRSVRLRPQLAEEAVGQLARRYGLGLMEAAEGIVEIANSNMLRALRLVSVQKGYDLRDFTLVAFGGAGPVHAGRLAQALNVPRVVVPAMSGVFSAFGCLVSDMRYDAVQTYLAAIKNLDVDRMEGAFRSLQESTLGQLAADGRSRAEVVVRRSLDMRYASQNYEIEVELPPGPLDPAEMDRRFRQRHETLYGYNAGYQIECVNLRVAAIVPTSHPGLPELSRATSAAAPTGSRRAYFRETGHLDLPVYARDDLRPGHQVAGPAVIEEEWSTTLIYPGQLLSVDRHGSLMIEVRP